jgi:hypothetical protein
VGRRAASFRLSGRDSVGAVGNQGSSWGREPTPLMKVEGTKSGVVPSLKKVDVWLASKLSWSGSGGGRVTASGRAR